MRRDCSEVARIVLYSGMKLHTKRFKLEFTDLILKQLPKLEKRLRFLFLILKIRILSVIVQSSFLWNTDCNISIPILSLRPMI